MKKLWFTILFCSIFMNAYAEQYVVEFIVVDGVKKQISSYTIPDGETPKTTNAYVLVTKEEYEGKLGDSTNWEQATTKWLKNADNVAKVDTAIANKPKSMEEQIAELQAKVDALEAKP